MAQIGAAFGHVADVLKQGDEQDARIYAAKTNAQIRAKMITGLAEKKNSGEDLTGLKGWTEQQTQGLYDQAIKDAPNDTARQLLGLDAVENTAEFGVQGLQAEAEYKVTKRLADISDTLAISANNLASDPGSFAQVYAQNKTLIDNTAMPIEARVKAENQLKQLGESAISGMIQSNPGAALGQLKSGQWDKYLDPGSRISLQARAENEIEQAQARARAEANQRTISGQIAAVNTRLSITDDIASIKETGHGIEGFSPEVVAQTIPGPAGAALATEFAAKRAAAIEYYGATNGLDDLPNAAIVARVSDAKDNLPKPGDPGYAAAVQTAKGLDEKATKIIKERQEDPAAAVNDTPEVKAATEQVDRTKPDTVQSLIAARLQAQRKFSEPGAGLPLTKVELRDLVAPLKNIPPSDSDNFYKTIDSLTATIRGTYGKYAPDVLRQLATHGGLSADAAETFGSQVFNASATPRGGKAIDAASDVTRGEQAMSFDPSIIAGVAGAADSAAKPQPNFKQINFLKGNASDAEIKRQFDEKFGAGAADAVLAGKTIP